MTSGRKKNSAKKAQLHCPHCGAGQIESVYAKTTICRACGRGFTISQQAIKAALAASKRATNPQADAPGKAPQQSRVPASPPPAPSAPPPRAEPSPDPGFLDRFKRMFVRQRERSITCFRCRVEQEISTSAKSASCRNCGIYIDLRDLKISGIYNRVIETQGTVFVTKTGDLTSPRVVCGEAQFRGPFQGSLLCTGCAKIRWKGRLIGALDAKMLVVERGADIEMARTIRARKIEIHGKLSARITADSVVVKKRGILEGTVYAKAFNVEKGGFFTGELVIGSQNLTQPDLLAPAQPGDPGEKGVPFALENGGELQLSPVA